LVLFWLYFALCWLYFPIFSLHLRYISLNLHSILLSFAPSWLYFALFRSLAFPPQLMVRPFFLQGGPLRELVNKLVHCMQDTGRVLKELQARSLGAFILQQAADTSTPLAASLVNSLQRFFKVALHDTADWKTTEVHFMCKAQLLVAQLHRRFQVSICTCKVAHKLMIPHGLSNPHLLRIHWYR
jgi:hypothetical protein